MDLDDPDLVTYRDFVRMMKDPTRNESLVNWISYSDIHGREHVTNLCAHGNWYFLPWHRGYLRMYEMAARTLTGNHNFALPYWDWTADRQIPRSFSDPIFKGQSNPLFVLGRSMRPTDSLPNNIVGQQEVMEGIYQEISFEAFGSSRARDQDSLDPIWIQRQGTASTLEYTPHNNIHGIIGRPFMHSAESPRDPIFLMHHCNIDRIWAVWNSLGRTNTSDPLWLDMPFSEHFIAPDGMRYTDIVRDLQEVVPLGYTYGLEAAAEYSGDPDRALHFSSIFSTGEELEIAGFSRNREMPTESAKLFRPLSVAMSSDIDQLRRSVRTDLNKSTAVTNLHEPQVYAIIRDLYPTKPDDTQLRVFVNCHYLSQSVPTSDPHYVTAIGFFGTGAHSGHKLSSLVNLTPALKRLARAQRLDRDEVVVQLLPTQQHGNDLDNAGSVEVGEVELVII